MSVRILVPILLSLMFGTVYFNIGKTGSHTRDNVIMLYFTMMSVVYISAYSMSIKCKYIFNFFRNQLYI